MAFTTPYWTGSTSWINPLEDVISTEGKVVRIKLPVPTNCRSLLLATGEWTSRPQDDFLGKVNPLPNLSAVTARVQLRVLSELFCAAAGFRATNSCAGPRRPRQ